MARNLNVGSWLAAMLGGLLALTGCGGGDDDEGEGAGAAHASGTVTAVWAGYCTGTFTEDTDIVDGFGDAMFTARAGEEYLLAEFGESFGEQRAEFVYLTAAGPEIFEVMPDASGAYPFTSDCEPDAGVTYYAAFTDVTVYADEALTTKICDLAAGTAMPAGTGGRGYSAAGGFSLSGPQTYEIMLNAFSEQCGGNESGYISVPQTELFGTRTWLVPIISIIGPE